MNRDWPPLIVATNQPRWVRRRDFVLTLAMWLLLAIMLETEFELFFRRTLKRWGLSDFDVNANWPEFFERLLPFVQIGLALIAVLIVTSLFTLRRRRRVVLLPQPPPLGLAEQARLAGLEQGILSAARELPIAVVFVEPDGSCSIKPR